MFKSSTAILRYRSRIVMSDLEMFRLTSFEWCVILQCNTSKLLGIKAHMDIAFPILLHLLVVIPSIILGLMNLALKKGTSIHKLNGKLWVVLMLIASLSSFFIMPTGSLTWLHLFAVLVIFTVLIGMFAIHKNNKKLHVGCMLGAYIGTVISAYIAASVPGRLLNVMLF